MRTPLVSIVGIAISMLLSACGAPTSNDAGFTDGGDTRIQDAGSTCEQYCLCEMMHCPTHLPTRMSCGDFCATFTAQQRECRLRECELARAGGASAMEHCPRSVGADGSCM